METDSPVVYHGTSESRFPPEERKRTQIQLSKDEIRVLRECNKESFYYRCLPFAVAGMAATFLAVRSGHLKSHHKWGPAGKMGGAAFVGYVLGKFSYRTACEDKFLKLENSIIGDAVRKRRGYVKETFESEGKSHQFGDEDLTVKDGSYSSFAKDDYRSGSLNLDVDKNISYSGLDDRERPTTDRESLNFDDSNQPVQKFTSYEELRERNRDEYEQHQRPSSAKTDSFQPVARRQWGENDNQRSRPNSGNQSEGGSKNAYGDSWDNPKFT